MRAPIVSRKHIIQHTQTTITSANVSTFVEVDALAVQNVNANFEVTEGSVLKNIYIELWIMSASTSVATFSLIVEKSMAGQVVPTFTNMTTLDAYPNKKNVLYSSQGLVADVDANPTPVLRQWIKIPRSKQRFGLDDQFRISIAAIGSANLLVCGLTIYKSYT